jgi:hypothetical protein
MWVSLLLVVSCSPFILSGAGSGEQERIESLVGLCTARIQMDRMN